MSVLLTPFTAHVWCNTILSWASVWVHLNCYDPLCWLLLMSNDGAVWGKWVLIKFGATHHLAASRQLHLQL